MHVISVTGLCKCKKVQCKKMKKGRKRRQPGLALSQVGPGFYSMCGREPDIWVKDIFAMNRVILVKPWVYVFRLGKLLDFCQEKWILGGGEKVC